MSSQNFAKVTNFSVDYAPASVSKWQSSRTGLQLVYINQPSPIVNGYFALATEIQNNSGCPHTLEHLVFMGSKKYPYKGLLDSLSNRLLSTTNAWTAVDQTVYTLTTAGWQGFKALLPVYLHHLLFPTLSPNAALTEVYHIDGSGKEKGVVFSEMQGIENQSWFITYLKMQELLYAPSSGYSSETGGLMKELRNLTNDQIIEFHKQNYRPDNLCVVVTGSVNEEELLNVMNEFDNQLNPKPSTSKPRPFIDSPHDGPLTDTIIERVEFPDKDESTGEMIISWIGPEANDNVINVAVDTIGAYFADSPISIFNKNLIEIENAYATDIDYTTDDYVRTALNFTVNGVPVEKLDELDSKMKELLAEQSKPENFDLTYLRQVLNQQKMKYVASTEKSPAIFANTAISDFIYGDKDGSDLKSWIKDLLEFDVLETWTADQWCKVIKDYFVDNKSASVLGIPSAKLNVQFKKEKKQMSKDVKAKYGPEGLKKLQENLEAAQAENDIPIPDELLINYEKPDPTLIEFIKTNSYKAGHTENIVSEKTNDYIESDDLSASIKADTPQDFPLFVHFEEYKSQFSKINLVMSSTRIESRLLSYMPIIEAIFSLSIQLPNEYIPYDEVISKIKEDVIEYDLDNGFNNQFCELVTVEMKFESTKYENSIKWLSNVLQYSVFEEARVKIIIDKVVNSLPDKKRDGEFLMYSAYYRKFFDSRSIRKAQDSIENEEFIKNLQMLINDGKFDQIKQDLDQLRSELFKLDNIKVILSGNVKGLKNPVSSWKPFVESFKEIESSKKEFSFNPESFEDLPRAFQFKSDLGYKCAKEAFLILTPAADSTHLTVSTLIPTDYAHEDLTKIALTTEFLCTVEGPFWRGIRGTGLAYGANIKSSVESGFLDFNIYRGSDPKQAFKVAKEIIQGFADGSVEVDALSIDNSISAIINAQTSGEENSSSAANRKILDNLFKRRGPNYVKSFLEKLNKLNKDDIIYALNTYFLPLFDAKSSVVITSIPSEKADEFKTFFSELGYNVNLEEVTFDDKKEESGHEHGHGCCGEEHSHSEEELSTDESDGSDDSDDSDEDSDESEDDN